MSDFLNKVVTIILIFVLLVIAPLLISYKTNEMLAKREILNDVQLFIDKVRDTASISEDDLNKLYLETNSHGLAVNVTVKRLVRAEVTKDGAAQTTYLAVDSFESLAQINVGDIIQVHVEEVTISAARRLTYGILKIDEGKFEFTLAGAVG